jgi:ABC-2 type transport system permease protein
MPLAPDRSPRRRDIGWRLFVRTALARAYPRVIGANRERAWIFFEILLPLVALSAYVFVYRGLDAPEAFVGFVILGGAMTAFWLNVMWAMSNQLFWEKETGNLALYVIAPGPMMAVLLGMALGGMFNATLRAIVIVTIGAALFGVGFTIDQPWMLLVVFCLTLAALYGMGMMFASLFLLLGREAWHLVNLAQEPVYFLSGTYFPVRSFPAWVAAGASLIPLTIGLDALRQLVFQGDAVAGLLDVRTEALGLAVMTVVFVAGARLSLAYMERLAIAEGRLTRSGA